MKKTNKKGFTLVELVIVIAVIAILAGVLIGTFASVISRANQSKAVQQWKAAIDEAYVMYVADKHVAPESVKISGAQITFADVESNATNKDNLVLLNNVYIKLDETYDVYFNWTYDEATETGNYSVTTTKEGNEAVATVEVYNKMLEDFKNSGNDWSTMNNYAFDSKQYYIVSSSNTFQTAGENQKVMLETVIGEGAPTFTLVTESAGDPATGTTYKYYLVQPFNGVWNSNKLTYSNFEFTPDTTTSTVGTWTLGN